QYQKLFAMDGVDLIFEEGALDEVVQRARKLGTGARGLRAVMEQVMVDIMYDMHSHPNVAVCRITSDTVGRNSPPLYEERKATAYSADREGDHVGDAAPGEGRHRYRTSGTTLLRPPVFLWCRTTCFFVTPHGLCQDIFEWDPRGYFILCRRGLPVFIREGHFYLGAGDCF